MSRERLLTDAEAASNLAAILASPSYRLAEQDTQFLARPGLRPVRMQLELLKPETILLEHGIVSTVVVFGSTQVIERRFAEARLAAARSALAEAKDNALAAAKDTAQVAAPAEAQRDAILSRVVARCERLLDLSHYYDEAREFARLISEYGQSTQPLDYVIVTGGGPGIMEAANRGAYDIGASSIGLNITLPAEQHPNPYITPGLAFQFHYFALRKMHFLLRARALIVFPGGFGTLDELFETLTLRQTGRMQELPVVMYGRDYWRNVVNFQFLADQGAIADAHLSLISYADTPQEAFETIVKLNEGVKPPG